MSRCVIECVIQRVTEDRSGEGTLCLSHRRLKVELGRRSGAVGAMDCQGPLELSLMESPAVGPVG